MSPSPALSAGDGDKLTIGSNSLISFLMRRTNAAMEHWAAVILALVAAGAIVGCASSGSYTRRAGDMQAAGPRPLPRADIVEIHQSPELEAKTDVYEGVWLLEFYTSHCGSCRRMKPIVRRLADQFVGRARVVKIDSDRTGALVRRYQVVATPTFIVLSNGVEVRRLVGPQPQRDLELLIKSGLDMPATEENRRAPGGRTAG